MGACSSSSSASVSGSSSDSEQQAAAVHRISVSANKQQQAAQPIDHENAPRISTVVSHPSESGVVSSAPSSGSNLTPSSSSTQMSDEEFRATIQSVLLLILDRFLQICEFEKEAFSQVALLTKYKQPNYLLLFGGHHVECFLRDYFDLQSTGVPTLGTVSQAATACNYDPLSFRLVIQALQNAQFKAPLPNKHTLTAALHRLIQTMSEELNSTLALLKSPAASSVAKVDELHGHITFFLNSFKFASGDIDKDTDLLTKNIDAICG